MPWWTGWRSKSFEQHAVEVRAIAESIRSRHDAEGGGEKDGTVALAAGPSNTMRSGRYKTSASVDISSLDALLEVNIQVSSDAMEWTVTVEPKMSMEALFAACRSHHCMPQVVTEFRSISVGGAIAGAALESSSCKYGQFSEQVTALEVILADGTILNCSPSQDADCFYGMMGAYGSLGIITACTLRVMPYRPYVRLCYRTFNQEDDFVSALAKGAKDGELVDALILEQPSSVTSSHATDDIPGNDNDNVKDNGKNLGYVLMEGQWLTAEEVDAQENNGVTLSLQHWWSPWFFVHVDQKVWSCKGLIADGEVEADLLRAEDYVFRYDRGAFWLGDHGFSHHPLSRLLFGYFTSSRKLYQALHTGFEEEQRSSLFLIQDIYTGSPASLQGLLAYCHEYIPFRPVWICPVRAASSSAQIFAPSALVDCQDDMCFNVGIYGVLETASAQHLRWLEEFLLQERGKCRKMLYATTLWSEKDFWTIYDRSRYQQLRQRYRAQSLVDIYRKVCRPVEES
jgi:Delta24-sterol reductase